MININKGYYIYALIDENKQCLYIGKTQDLKRRIQSHVGGNSNIPEECVSKIKYVKYLSFLTKSDMDIYEIYLINYYAPPYNIDSKSELGYIRLGIPKLWNEYDIKTNTKIGKEHVIGVLNKDSYIENPVYYFNKNIVNFDGKIMSNENLTKFLNKHIDKYLSDSEFKELLNLCEKEDDDLEKLNNYIGFNDSRIFICKDDKGYKIIKKKTGRYNYGSLFKHDNYLIYKINFNHKRKAFAGKTKTDIATKVQIFLNQNIKII